MICFSTPDNKVVGCLCQTHGCIFCLAKMELYESLLWRAFLEKVAPLYSFRSNTYLLCPILLWFLQSTLGALVTFPPVTIALKELQLEEGKELIFTIDICIASKIPGYPKWKLKYRFKMAQGWRY